LRKKEFKIQRKETQEVPSRRRKKIFGGGDIGASYLRTQKRSPKERSEDWIKPAGGSYQGTQRHKDSSKFWLRWAAISLTKKELGGRPFFSSRGEVSADISRASFLCARRRRTGGREVHKASRKREERFPARGKESSGREKREGHLEPRRQESPIEIFYRSHRKSQSRLVPTSICEGGRKEGSLASLPEEPERS